MQVNTFAPVNFSLNRSWAAPAPVQGLDTFTPGSSNSLGIYSPRDFASVGRGPGGGTQGTSVGATQDKGFYVGIFEAAKNGDQLVDWKNPAAALDKMTQIDARTDTIADQVRCGAATLVAGAVLRGPEQFQEGLSNVLNRADALNEQLTTSSKGATGAAAEFGQKMQGEIEHGMKTLEKYERRDPKTLTYKEMAEIQEAVYVIARNDQRTGAGARTVDPDDSKHQYLLTDTMGEYGKLMWGDKAPKMGGQKLETYWVDNQKGGGHFVLGDKNGQVYYNPWPDEDGTAYSRGVDGKGAVIGKDLQGKRVQDMPHTLPAR